MEFKNEAFKSTAILTDDTETIISSNPYVIELFRYSTDFIRDAEFTLHTNISDGKVSRMMTIVSDIQLESIYCEIPAELEELIRVMYLLVHRLYDLDFYK